MYPTIINLGSIPLGPIDIPLAIHSYGLMLASAFLTVMFIAQRELARKQLDSQLASSVVFASAVGGIVGAKLYAAFEDGSFSVSELFSTSGLVWYGGMIGGAAAAFFVLHRSASPTLPVLDAFAPLFLLGYGIGRIGCFPRRRWRLRRAVGFTLGDGVPERHGSDRCAGPPNTAL